jgi:hypothetical protein
MTNTPDNWRPAGASEARWQLLPIPPTEAMIEAGVKDHRHEQSFAGAEETYLAMVAAAPAPPDATVSAERTPEQIEISKCWERLEESGFPPEASGWPFQDIRGELPSAIDAALDCLIRQREDLLAEVTKLRAAPASAASDWQLLPKEPTTKMFGAFISATLAIDHTELPAGAFEAFAQDYRAMLAAAPAPQDVGREATIEEARQEIVLAIAFLTRDGNTDRITETVRQLISCFASADAKLRALSANGGGRG